EILGRQAARRDHSGQTSRRVRAAAEPENKNRVAFFINVCDRGVAVLDFLKQADAECSSQQLSCKQSFYSDPVVVKSDLCRRDGEALVDFVDIRVRVTHLRRALGMVPGAVRAENDLLCHFSSECGASPKIYHACSTPGPRI